MIYNSTKMIERINNYMAIDADEKIHIGLSLLFKLGTHAVYGRN